MRWRSFFSACSSVTPWRAKCAAAASPPMPADDREAKVAACQSVALIQRSQLQRSVSQCARPMWSGCMWVTITRSTGSPSSSLANTCSQAARVRSSVMPQSTMAQPSRPWWRSRSSHRLMWSSAKGRPMRSHFTPGATSMVWPSAGSVSPSG